MYTVIHEFCDLKDKKHVYRVGDKFPRSGISVDESRIAELAGKANKLKTPLIKEEVKAEPKKRTKKNADGNV